MTPDEEYALGLTVIGKQQAAKPANSHLVPSPALAAFRNMEVVEYAAKHCAQALRAGGGRPTSYRTSSAGRSTVTTGFPTLTTSPSSPPSTGGSRRSGRWT